jgi:Uma2 family endonuclease
VPSFAPIAAAQQFVLERLPWASYTAICDALPNWPRLRTTYDRGSLELMTTSNLHEWLKSTLGRFIELAAEELGVPYQPGGGTTFRDQDRDRGFEPDLCYWVANEARMRVPPLLWDPALHPVPDLIVEIEVTRTAADRMAVFAAYGVPEVWRTDGNAITIHLLGPAGTYQPAAASRSFPRLPVADLARFLRPDPTRDSLTANREFRAWVRQVVAGRDPSS